MIEKTVFFHFNISVQNQLTNIIDIYEKPLFENRRPQRSEHCPKSFCPSPPKRQCPHIDGVLFFYKGASLWWCGDTAWIFWIPILCTKITFCVSGSTEQWGTRPRGSQRNSWKRRTNCREVVHFVQFSKPAGEKLPKMPKFPNKLERKCPKCPTFQTS